MQRDAACSSSLGTQRDYVRAPPWQIREASILHISAFTVTRIESRSVALCRARSRKNRLIKKIRSQGPSTRIMNLSRSPLGRAAPSRPRKKMKNGRGRRKKHRVRIRSTLVSRVSMRKYESLLRRCTMHHREPPPLASSRLLSFSFSFDNVRDPCVRLAIVLPRASERDLFPPDARPRTTKRESSKKDDEERGGLETLGKREQGGGEGRWLLALSQRQRLPRKVHGIF